MPSEVQLEVDQEDKGSDENLTPERSSPDIKLSRAGDKANGHGTTAGGYSPTGPIDLLGMVETNGPIVKLL